MTVVVGLGDSITYGVGDAGSDFVGPSWSGRLAHSIGATSHRNFSYPGAQSRHLVRQQLPAAEGLRPDVVLLSVGGNDALRSSFRAERLCCDVRTVLERLMAIGTRVVLLGLPDPMGTSPAPVAIRRVLRRRIECVNRALDEAASGTSTIMLHTWDDPMAYRRDQWHVDRMHPSAAGYQHLADQARRALGLTAVNDPIPVEQRGPNPTAWMLTHATVWFVKRSVDLLPGLVAMGMKERGALQLSAYGDGPRLRAALAPGGAHR